MMKLKTQLTALALLTAISIATMQSSHAAGFCGNRTSVSYGGSATVTGDIDANHCIEIGAWNYGGEGGYAGSALNVNMLSGSLISVLGFMEDSTVNSGAEVYVTQVSKIASGGFDATVPATASNITVLSGGLVRVFDGGTLKNSLLEGGTAYVSNSGTTDKAGQAVDNEVNSGGKLFVYEKGRSDGTIINKGGYEYAQQSGISDNAQINGGLQYVTLSGVANGATVNSEGRQYVYNSGVVNDTIVNDGGLQYLFVNGSDTTATAGVAVNTTLNGTGSQVIQQGGKATFVTLNDSAVQTINTGSSAENVTINDSGRSWLASGAKITGATVVNNSGQLQLSTSDTGGASADNVTLNDADSTLLIIANNSGDAATVGEIAGQGNVRFYTSNDSASGTPVYSVLNVDSLSGNLHFYFNSSIEGGAGDYLRINQGIGNHNVTVADSGAEITEPGQRSLDIISDASGGARFSLASLKGTNINAIDGGTYMYSLYDRDESEGKIWYLAAEKEPEEVVPPVTEPGGETPPVTEPGGETPPVTEPGGETPPVTEPGGETPPVTEPGEETPSVTEPGEETPSVPEPEQPGVSINPPKTAPGTDAVLSMSVAPMLMFKNEMQNLRFRQGLSEKTDGDNGAWVRFTGGNSNVNSGHTHFKFEQSGLELGVDYVFDSADAKTRAGLFTSYNSGRVKHARGGVSRIDSISVGAQATWFHNQGWYVDGLLKYNRFDNTLSAMSTNGNSIFADYSQNALGASLEFGKSIYVNNEVWAEPYARLSAVRLEGQNIRLNNQMKGNIRDQNSLTTELGFNLGRTFSMDKNSTITPFVKAAWVREYVDNNTTGINDRNTFVTDLSGNTGKFGLGINASFNKELSLFAEVDYAKGEKQEDPLQANVGFRYSF